MTVNELVTEIELELKLMICHGTDKGGMNDNRY
jgi:hypothetical protein